jgi:hypothetical protein
MQQESAALPSEGFVRLKTILRVIPVGKTYASGQVILRARTRS